MLVGTMANQDFIQISSEFAEHSLPIYKIGKVMKAGKAAVYLNRDQQNELLAKKGFNHFRER